MKKIWDAQNNQPLYAFDEQALHHRIQSRKDIILRFASVNEWVLILIYLFAGGEMIKLNHLGSGVNIFEWLEGAWMFGTVGYIVAHHIRRIRTGRHFDRSIRGDLDHTISIASYQLRLSQIIRWNLVPMGAIMILSGWESGKLIRVSLVILVSFTLAFYVVSRGIRGEKRRKRGLLLLKGKLESGM